MTLKTIEEIRQGAEWRFWGPYLSERQWGTVREDYSENGDAWGYFTHEMAQSRAYRWGEDGLGGICDKRARLCFALALWNGKDECLKERLFGVTGPEGNHGEDVKEIYYYLDNTPSHSYMRMLYKYPQNEFPYTKLRQINRQRSRLDLEYEIVDTGIFDSNQYWDIDIEYAKAGPDDILIQITANNRSEEAATLWLIPQLWFRNTWSWQQPLPPKPLITKSSTSSLQAHSEDPEIGTYLLHLNYESNFLFCENETNVRKLSGQRSTDGYFKDAFHDYIVRGQPGATNPAQQGTKAGAPYNITVAASQSAIIKLRLSRSNVVQHAPFDDFDAVFQLRKQEADEFYANLQGSLSTSESRLIHRQALAGMLWSKQYYCFDVRTWLDGDSGCIAPSTDRQSRRNSQWQHMFADDIICMPDTWEYPWFAAWDLAFHCIPLALVDSELAKKQLLLLTREWFMHPSGQLPAYEWSFSDVNPPVHAWAALRVYHMDKEQNDGKGDTDFLERLLHKLALNFTWWVNRKDAEGNNIFQGGFLGLDNIGVFDRSAQLPTGGHLEQADATAWMAMYALNLMRISLELALVRPLYQDMAIKFLEHFLLIAEAMMTVGGNIKLWDEQDEFYYDVLHAPHSTPIPLRIRSLVGLIPLFAVEVLEPELLSKLPAFKRRLEWLFEHRPSLTNLVSRWLVPGSGERRLLSLLRGHRMKRVLRRMLDESEFLSHYGVRSLSKYHLQNPYIFRADSMEASVTYTPAESDSSMFGGNSNWRGPIWFPVNYMIIESLRLFHTYYGDDFKVECPTKSGNFLTLNQIADELTDRLCKIFLRDDAGKRAGMGPQELFQRDPHFQEHLFFYEYFHGDSGRGLGASHQTGWTSLIANLLIQSRR
jgi:hypothetical protein